MSEPVAAGPFEGRCLCGAVRIGVASVPDARPGACHCEMCRRWTGAGLFCLTAPAEAVEVTGEVVRHASSRLAERAFCPVCGSHLWMRDTGAADAAFDLVPGLFEAARDWPLQSEIYSDRALASVRLAGGQDRTTGPAWESQNPFVEEDRR